MAGILQSEIQAKYNKATEAYGSAKAILEEFGDKPMPQEKQNDVDRWFEAFDGFVAEAKRLEGARAREAILVDMEKPTNDLDAPKGSKPGDDSTEARERKELEAKAVKAFGRAVRGGPRILTQDEAKALRVDHDPSGGFLVAPQTVVNELLKLVDDQVFMRQWATVYRLDKSESLGVPSLDSDMTDADWTSELTIGSEDTLTFGKRELKPSPLSKEIKISRKLLRQATINVEALVRDRMAYRFGITTEKAYLTGSGTNQPLGVFTAAADGISTGRDVTAAGSTTVVGDDFIDLKFKLKGQYWSRAKMLLHRDLLKIVRKLKDADNNYIWSPGMGPGGGLAPGIPSTIVDIPFQVSEFAPNTYSTGRYVAVVGDFSFYWIAEALNFEIQVLMELHSRTNQVGYIGRLETDGMPVHEEAFARLKLA